MPGVIKALEDNEIKIDAISGTSSGSFIASLYAMGYSPSYIYSIFKKYAREIAYVSNGVIINEVRNLIFSKKLITRGIKDGRGIEDVYERLARKKGIKKISDINMPLIIPAVDMSEAKEYIFTSIEDESEEKYISDIGVGKAVRASGSFPVVMNPCEYKGHIFSDGGILNNIPVMDIKRIGIDKVIAIRFDSEKVDNESNVMDIMMKTVDIMSNKISEEHLAISDYILTIPSDGTGLLDISKIDFCYKSGYNTTIENLDKIKEILNL